PLGHLLNTSVTVATFHESTIELERYNDGSHHPSTTRFTPERFGSKSAVLAAMAVGSGALHVEPSLVGEVEHIFASPRDEAKAHALRAELAVPVQLTTEPFDVLLERIPAGRRALIVTSPEEIRDAASRALRPGARSR